MASRRSCDERSLPTTLPAGTGPGNTAPQAPRRPHTLQATLGSLNTAQPQSTRLGEAIVIGALPDLRQLKIQSGRLESAMNQDKTNNTPEKKKKTLRREIASEGLSGL